MESHRTEKMRQLLSTDNISDDSEDKKARPELKSQLKNLKFHEFNVKHKSKLFKLKEEKFKNASYSNRYRSISQLEKQPESIQNSKVTSRCVS